MIHKYKLFLFNKHFILNYLFRLLIINFFGLLFLYDTDSFNQGLVSVQSLIYSINSLLTFFFLTLEFVASILQFYGLDHKFLKLIFLDIESINFLYVYEIAITILNYIFFIILTSLIIFNRELMLKNIFKKRIILLLLIVVFTILFIKKDFSKKLFYKINNFNKNVSEYSLLRNDNWYLYYEYKRSITPNINFDKNKFYVSDFSNLIDPTLHKNIFIIINESYPNFKNPKIKKNLINYIYDEKILNDFQINNYVTNWSKKYSTQGAELKLFCGSNMNFEEFKKKELKVFIDNNNCYFKKFDKYNKIFIHSYHKSSFNRARYESFFDKTFFYNDLKDKNLDICEGRPFTAHCDHQLVEKMNDFKTKEKNLIIYLTVNNHIPVKLIKNVNKKYCKKNFPLNIHDQFCFIYQNQILFNKGLKKFINTLSKDDFLIYYSDTPPIFPIKHRIHFEDYIDVYTFKKK